MGERDIKKEIRKLKKLKLQLHAGTLERLDLEHKIKGLKRQLKELNTPEPEKEKLIVEILKLEPNFPKDLVDLNKFTPEQLQKHIDIVKRKKGLNF